MNNDEIKNVEEKATNDAKNNEEFNGTFHEKDSHDVNDIVKEISDSFLDYSMSVITSRAIPDLRDGLKPVHRRILWSMFEEGNTPDKPHKKINPCCDQYKNYIIFLLVQDLLDKMILM